MTCRFSKTLHQCLLLTLVQYFLLFWLELFLLPAVVGHTRSLICGLEPQRRSLWRIKSVVRHLVKEVKILHLKWSYSVLVLVGETHPEGSILERAGSLLSWPQCLSVNGEVIHSHKKNLLFVAPWYTLIIIIIISTNGYIQTPFQMG